VNLAERIGSRDGRLTPAEQRLVEILFSTNLLAGLDTVARLAERAHVSGPTVLRLAAKLGFDSFPDFQDYLKQQIETRLASPLESFGRQPATGSEQALAQAAAEIFAEGIKRSLDRIEVATLDAIAELLADGSRPVSLIGGRFTHHLAEILWGHLHQLRPRAHILRGGVVAIKEQMIDMGRRDVLVVFDVRRYQDDIVEIAEAAKRRRATIILITDPLLSPIARFANIVVTSNLDSPSPYDSLVPAMAVLEVIVAAVIRRAQDSGRRRVAEIETLRAPVPRPANGSK
jgi:DNA-binding MurR/RpiR family transcriptional regulator